MLRLPAEGEEAPALLRAAEEPAGPLPDAVEEASAAPAEQESASPVLLLVAISVAGIAGLWGFTTWLKKERAEHAAASTVVAEQAPATKPKEEEPADLELAGLPDVAKLLVQADPVIKGFLNAKTMEEALPYVSQPERVRRRWPEWLAGKPYQAEGYHSLVKNSEVAFKELFSVNVVTSDFATRSIALRMEKKDLKVDWEAWTGWSEMKWDEMRKKKPVEPKLFRAYVSSSSYYNFLFADDKKWTSFQLESPDGESALVGYAAKDSLVDTTLKGYIQPHIPVLVKIRYPEGAKVDDQVIIDEVGEHGWLDY